MPQQPEPIVVIGASAGGVEALCGLLRQLPADFPGAILIVLHAGAGTESQLPRILNRCGNLTAEHVHESAEIRAGGVYVARPNQHLVLEPGRVRIDHGPRENGYRPSINRLFESAAAAYGNGVVGVVLSGALSDGTLGLLVIKRAGGLAMVQDPDEALFAGMPQSAIDNVDIDFYGSTAEIAAELVRIARNGLELRSVTMGNSQNPGVPDYQARSHEAPEISEIAGYACPECGGVLREEHVGNLVRFRCHVGHEVSEDGLLRAQGEKVEAALWTALRVLDERIQLVQRAANRASERGNRYVADRFREQSRQAQESAEIIRRVLRGDGERSSITTLQDEPSQLKHQRSLLEPEKE